MNVGAVPHPRPNVGPDAPRCRDIDPRTRGLRADDVGEVLDADGLDTYGCIADRGYDDVRAWRDLAATVSGYDDARVALDPHASVGERFGHGVAAIAGYVPEERALAALPRLEKAVELAGAERVIAAARSPRLDIVGHEVLGGHTLAKHVGPPRELRERLVSSPRLSSVSSYPTTALANRVVVDTLKAARHRIHGWLADARETTPLTIESKMHYRTGSVLTRRDTLIRTNHAKTVLVKDAAAPEGYYVLTSFPIEAK